MAQEEVDDGPDSLRNTDQTDYDQTDVVMRSVDPGYWGKLAPVAVNQPFCAVGLKKDHYTAGRAPNCDILFGNEFNVISWHNEISKIHFVIRRRRDEGSSMDLVEVEDRSSNGTFVNGKKIGRGRTIMLTSGDVISLCHHMHQVYTFLSETVIHHWLPSDLAAQYLVMKTLGSGAFGEVNLVMDKTTLKKYAMKKIPKEKVDEKMIHAEVDVLKIVNHRFIVQLQDVHDSPDAVFLTLEYIENGNLLRKITREGKISEHQSKMIFYQTVLAVDYLHKTNVIHRDIKPENILLSIDRPDEVEIKLADFGLSKMFDSMAELITPCGTPKYMAPEVLNNRGFSSYTTKVDVWSLGVVLYYCLSGRHPFAYDKMADIVGAIREGRVNLRGFLWHSLSSAQDLIRRMLAVSPQLRISVEDICRHSWLAEMQGFRTFDESIINRSSSQEIQIPPPKKHCFQVERCGV